MKKILSLLTLAIIVNLGAQTSANRFFYELTFKPKKDSARLDKVMAVLDITKEKSLFRDYTMLAQDSLLKAKIELMQKSGSMNAAAFKSMKMPKFNYKIEKKYPELSVKYIETMINGMSPINLAYSESPKFEWKILPDKQKIGEYNTQKATTEFGGRKWNAWFAKDIPLQDGPYKFCGLPGLIVKIEDEAKNYSWELKGNKEIKNFEEQTQLEKMRGVAKITEVPRDKFEKTFEDYKKDPLASLRQQMTPEMMSTKIPGQDKTVGEVLKDSEKRTKDFFSANDNPIEITSNTASKKK